VFPHRVEKGYWQFFHTFPLWPYCRTPTTMCYWWSSSLTVYSLILCFQCCHPPLFFHTSILLVGRAPWAFIWEECFLSPTPYHCTNNYYRDRFPVMGQLPLVAFHFKIFSLTSLKLYRSLAPHCHILSSSAVCLSATIRKPGEELMKNKSSKCLVTRREWANN